VIALGCSTLACGAPAEPPPLVLLAPDHLAPLVAGLLGALDPAHSAQVRIRTDTQDRVIRQVNSGTPADLVITGAPAIMDGLVGDGHVADPARRPLAFDELVLVTPVGAGLQGPPPPLRRMRIPGPDTLPGAQAAAWAPPSPVERLIGGEERELLAALEPGEAAVVRETLALSADRPLTRTSTGAPAPAGFVIEVAPLEASRDPAAAAALAALLEEAPAARRQVDAMGLGWPRGSAPPQPQPVR
jgi:hypothetical protein